MDRREMLLLSCLPRRNDIASARTAISVCYVCGLPLQCWPPQKFSASRKVIKRHSNAALVPPMSRRSFIKSHFSSSSADATMVPEDDEGRQRRRKNNCCCCSAVLFVQIEFVSHCIPSMGAHQELDIHHRNHPPPPRRPQRHLWHVNRVSLPMEQDN